MGEEGGVYVLDEPTTGLHLADLAQLLGLLDRLVDSGKSVIVIEHHLSVMAHADWIIDLGPGAGHDGGRIVFEGTPADLVAAKSTLTGEHLAAFVRQFLAVEHFGQLGIRPRTASLTRRSIRCQPPNFSALAPTMSPMGSPARNDPARRTR